MKPKSLILFLLILLSFVLSSCGEEVEEYTVYLQHEGDLQEITYDSDEFPILPAKMKDDYVFIGWTDGEGHYMGLTEDDVNGKTLTPDYVPIEDVFTHVIVIGGQAQLGEYVGESTMVGIPYEWNGYLIHRVNSFKHRDDIESIYLPSSVRYLPEIMHMTSLKDIVFYGDVRGFRTMKSVSQDFLEEIMTTHDCEWDGSASFEDHPTQSFDDCPIIRASRLGDGVAIPNPSDGDWTIRYFYEVILDLSLYDDESFFSYMLPPSVKHMVLPHHVSDARWFDTFCRTNKFDHLIHGEGLDPKIYYQDGMMIRNTDNGSYIMYIDSEEDTLDIDVSEYLLASGFGTSPQVRKINISGGDDVLYDKRGVVYLDSRDFDEQIRLYHIPIAYGRTTYRMPDDITTMDRNAFVNHTIEEVELNDSFKNLEYLIESLTELTHIDVSDNPNYIEEDGVIYDADKATLFFINEGVEHVTIPATVRQISSIYMMYALKNVTSVDVKGTHGIGHLGMALAQTTNLDELTINPNHEHYEYIDGVLYDKNTGDVIYRMGMDLDEYLDSMDDDHQYDEHGVEVDDEQTLLSVSDDLLHLDLPTYVEQISNNLFHNIGVLRSINFHEGIHHIPHSLLFLLQMDTLTLNAETVVGVDIPSSSDLEQDMGDNKIYRLSGCPLETIYVPNNLLDDYKNDPFWKQFSDVLKAIE